MWRLLKEDLRKHWLDAYEVVILCESEGQKARLEEILEESADIVSLYVGTLQSGFTYRPGKVFLINDHEIYSRVPPQTAVSPLSRRTAHQDRDRTSARRFCRTRRSRNRTVRRRRANRNRPHVQRLSHHWISRWRSGFCASGSNESGAKIFGTRWHSTRIEQIGHSNLGAAKGKDAQSHIQNGGGTRVIIRRTQGATGAWHFRLTDQT